MSKKYVVEYNLEDSYEPPIWTVDQEFDNADDAIELIWKDGSFIPHRIRIVEDE